MQTTASKIRQIGMLCEATNIPITNIVYDSSGAFVRLQNGDLFGLPESEPEIVVLYKRCDMINDRYQAGSPINLFALMEDVGMKAKQAGLPYRQDWGEQCPGYKLGYLRGE